MLTPRSPYLAFRLSPPLALTRVGRQRCARPFARAIACALLWAAAFPAASTADAQSSTSRGWSLGVQAQGTSLTIENDDERTGGSLALRAGYGFNRRLTVFLAVDAGEIDVPSGENLVGEWVLSHAEIGARFHFANSLRRWVPYLEASVGGRSVSIDEPRLGSGERLDRLSFNGGVLSFGGGLSVFVSRRVAIDATLRFSGGTFNEIDVGSAALRDLDLDASSTRFGVGIVFWP